MTIFLIVVAVLGYSAGVLALLLCTLAGEAPNPPPYTARRLFWSAFIIHVISVLTIFLSGFWLG